MAELNVIALKNGWHNFADFTNFINYRTPYTARGNKINIPDSEIPELERRYREYLAERQKVADAQQQIEDEKQRIADKKYWSIENRITVIAGDHFDGFKITDYGNFLTACSMLQVDSSTIYPQTIIELSASALHNMKESICKNTNYNAIIGFKYDYFCVKEDRNGYTENNALYVVASGTPVRITAK